MLAAMLGFEARLARAQAACGLIPAPAAAAIERAYDPAAFDIAAIGRAATLAGNPAIPLVQALRARVGTIDPAAAAFVHLGATSQDVLDSALLRMIEDALAVMRPRYRRLVAGLAALADTHRATLMTGRTLLQPAQPVTFGFKAALWLHDAIAVHDRLFRLEDHGVRYGGAVGTLGSLGDRGPDVLDALLRDGDTNATQLAWRSIPARLVATGTELAILNGALGKIARDVTLLMQFEVAEAFEAAPGGSSAMPHKRNPVLCPAILAAATRIPGLAAGLLASLATEHERATGAWQAQGPILRDLVTIAGTALTHAATLVETLRIDPARMRANLDALQGLPMSEQVAHALPLTARPAVEAACRVALAQRRPLAAVLADDPVVAAHLTPAALDALTDPANALGMTDHVIGTVLMFAGDVLADLDAA
jgi:3-carboxy-cis,cis-muconate cycloisomerase